MVIEIGDAGAAAEELDELLVGFGAATAVTGFAGGLANREGDGAKAGEFEFVLSEGALDGEARNVWKILEAIELFLFDGEENGVFVEKGDGGAAAESGDAEDAERERAHGTRRASDSEGESVTGSAIAA
jgi:hypothetical protein